MLPAWAYVLIGLPTVLVAVVASYRHGWTKGREREQMSEAVRRSTEANRRDAEAERESESESERVESGKGTQV